jgi:hypothetical protein
MKYGILVESMQHVFRAGLYGVRVRCVLLPMLAILMVVLPGCGELRPRDSDKRVSETEMQKEVAGLVKIYRQCLQKYEEYPEKSKEHCGVYKDAIQALAPEHKRSIVAELMERLRGEPSQ